MHACSAVIARRCTKWSSLWSCALVQDTLPTLMPFMVLSNFIVYTGCAKPIGVLLAPLTKLLHLPAASGYCILIGFVCGYPMGAYVCGCLNETGTIDDDTAMLLAPVCNNVSPMFMISYICMSCLGDKALSGTVICLLIGSAFAGMFVLRYWGWIKKQHGRRKISRPGRCRRQNGTQKPDCSSAKRRYRTPDN